MVRRAHDRREELMELFVAFVIIMIGVAVGLIIQGYVDARKFKRMAN